MARMRRAAIERSLNISIPITDVIRKVDESP
jgi:hypothetical protein